LCRRPCNPRPSAPSGSIVAWRATGQLWAPSEIGTAANGRCQPCVRRRRRHDCPPPSGHGRCSASLDAGPCATGGGGPAMPCATSPRRGSGQAPVGPSPTASTTSGGWHGGSASGRPTRASDRAALLPSG
jgi:hypothetical protein